MAQPDPSFSSRRLPASVPSDSFQTFMTPELCRRKTWPPAATGELMDSVSGPDVQSGATSPSPGATAVPSPSRLSARLVAIVATTARRYTRWPALSPERIGWGAGQRELADRLRPSGIRLIAESVEDADIYESSRAAGYPLFQGHYFCRPKMCSAAAVRARHAAENLPPIHISPDEGKLLHVLLRAVRGLADAATCGLLVRFGSPEAVLGASSADLTASGHVGSELAEAIHRGPDESSRKAVERELKTLDRLKASMITVLDRAYPPRLKTIPDPPPFLYTTGALLPADAYAVAIVGSRKATAAGRLLTEELSRALAAMSAFRIAPSERGNELQTRTPIVQDSRAAATPRANRPGLPGLPA